MYDFDAALIAIIGTFAAALVYPEVRKHLGIFVIIVSVFICGLYYFAQRNQWPSQIFGINDQTSYDTINVPVTYTEKPSYTPTPYEQVRYNAKAQGITIPNDFTITCSITGKLENTSGSEYYAIYKYKDPYKNVKFDHDTLWFYNSTNPQTANYDVVVTYYGSYNGCPLYCLNGEYFWGSKHDYFKPY